MHNIILPEDTSSNCFDSIVYALLKYYNFDYEAYNIKYFYTDYYRILPNNIIYSICRGKSYKNILKDVYDIDFSYKDKHESIDLPDIVHNSLKNNPVGISVDPYYCHWSPFYHKAHYSHMILIVDIDYCDKKYVCFDVHYNSCGYVKIDFDVINENFEDYFIFYFGEVKEVKPELLIDNVRISLDNFDNNLDAKKAELIDYFIMNDRKMLFPQNLEASIPLINLMWIVEDKKHFPIALRYIEDKIQKSVFSSIYRLFSVSERKFLLLKSVLMKYAISGVLREETLRSIINQVFDTDALIVEQMKTIVEEMKYK